MSDRREAALAAVRAVVPCDYGDDLFKLMAPEYVAGGGTSCTFLAMWAMFAAGCRDSRVINRTDAESGLVYLPSKSVDHVYFGSQHADAWHARTDGGAPQPGDVYFIHGPISGGMWDPNTEHVGIILDANGSVWTTADAGQRNARGEQCAHENRRPYDGVHLGGLSGPRELAGWIDLDRLTYSAPALYGSGGASTLGLLLLLACGGVAAAKYLR